MTLVAVITFVLGLLEIIGGIALIVVRTSSSAQTNLSLTSSQIVIAGMHIPPNLGPDYSGQFYRIFIDLSRKNKAALIPFLLEDVGGIPKLNQADGIHPTAEGHKIVAENVWKVLEPVLKKQQL